MTRVRFKSIPGNVKLKGLILLIVLAGSILLFWPRPSTREVDVLVPVVPENIAPGYTILDTPLKPLEVRLLGSPTDLALVNNSKLFYRLDLSDLGFGVHSIPIRPGDISLAKGVSIIHFHPKTFEITIDREIEKAIPVIRRRQTALNLLQKNMVPSTVAWD